MSRKTRYLILILVVLIAIAVCIAYGMLVAQQPVNEAEGCEEEVCPIDTSSLGLPIEISTESRTGS